RSRMTARPPPARTVRTVASPSPEAPPVTRATVSASFMVGRHSRIAAPPTMALPPSQDPTRLARMRFDAAGHPLPTRPLSIGAAARADDRLDVHGTVLDVRKRGFVPVAGDLQGAGIIHDMRLAATVDPATRILERIDAEQRSVAFEPSAA